MSESYKFCLAYAMGYYTYKDYLASDIWKGIREQCLQQKSSCQKCGSKKNLQVHHKTYENCGNEVGRDLIVLCRKCHKGVHNK